MKKLVSPLVADRFESWFKQTYPGRSLSMQNEGSLLLALELPDFTPQETTAILKAFRRSQKGLA